MKVHDIVIFKGTRYFIQAFIPKDFSECIIISKVKYNYNKYLTIPINQIDKLISL